ncbi:MAG: GxxExxY protein [Candidatus Margulisbacteria bacterium]|nr:GxxExxY protein [Candidatus Margulisiibacteriota bacterium]
MEQEKVKMAVNGIHIGDYFIDFVIDEKIVLEIKATPRFSRRDVLQVIRYLKTTGLNLGILAGFSRKELIYKRILRGYDH